MLIEFQNKIYQGSNNRKSVFDCKIPNRAKAVVLFIHGYKGYKDWGAWNLMEDFFIKNEYGFAKFNISHNGGTVENPIDFPDLQAFGENRYSYEVKDLNIIIEEVDRIIKQELELDIPIYIIGHSRGGGVAILTAANNEKVKKVVSLAGICDIESRFLVGEDLLKWEREGVFYVVNGRTNQSMPHFYSFYKDFYKNKAILIIEEEAKKLSIPFIQIHGDMDLAVSISEGQRIASWTETELEIIKGAGHTFGASHPWNNKEIPEDLKRALNVTLDFFNLED